MPDQIEEAEVLDLEAIRAELRTVAALADAAADGSVVLAHRETMAWVSLGRRVPALVDALQQLVADHTILWKRYEDRVEELERARGRLALASRYTINAVPANAPQAYHWEITVEWRGEGRWAVVWGGFCLGTDGEWEYESIPSERRDDWLAAHRFDLETALRLAEREAPEVEVNGLTAREAAARAEVRRA